MKQFRLLILSSLILSALSFSAKGADFSFTVNWDNPGAVQIVQGGLTSPTLEIDATKTTWTGTETGSYYVKPAPGYILVSVWEKYYDTTTKKEVERENKIGGNDNYGQYCGIPTYSSHNGAVYTITTKKLTEVGKFTLDVKNGATKIKAWFKNDKAGGKDERFSSFSKPAIVKGEQQVSFTDQDKYLNIYPLGTSKIFKVTLNGQAQTPKNNVYEIPIKSDDKVMVQVFENDPAACDVTVKFTNSENCLRDIYYAGTGKFYSPEQLAAINNKLTVDEGDLLKFNYHEDYNISAIKVNGTPLTEIPDNSLALNINENTEVEFTATGKVYTPVPVTLYLKNPEGIVIRKGAFDESEIIPLGEGEELTEDVIFNNSNNYVVKAGEAKKFVIEVSGKEKKFFWSAKPGYWIDEAVMANPEDKSYTRPNPGVHADNAPIYLAAKPVSTDNVVVFFFDGAEKETQCYAKNKLVAGQLTFPGMEDRYIPVGYTISSFDIKYHELITAGKVGEPKDHAIELFVNGMKQTKQDDGTFSFTLEEIGGPSIVKVFSCPADAMGDVKNPTQELTINFESVNGNSAEVTYDKLFKHTDVSTALKVVGKTLVSMKPADGTIIVVDGEVVEPNADGNCEFWASKRKHNVVFTDASGVEEIGIEDSDANAKVYNLQGIEMKGDFNQLPAGVYVRNGKKIIKK